MRTRNWVLIPALAAALLIVFAVACGGGDSQEAASGQPAAGTAGDAVAETNPGGDGDSQVSSAPIEVLATSAESFQNEVRSLQAEMDLNITMDGVPIEATADMAYQAPDQMHLTMDFTNLIRFEMLMAGSDIYVNMPPQGWTVFSLDDLAGVAGGGAGVDVSAIENLFSKHSVVDYAAVITSLGGEVQDLGEETLDGETYLHYRGSLDFADLAAAFNDAAGVSDSLTMAEFGGPLTLDAWLYPDTLLPHILRASGEFDFGTAPAVFEANMRFFGYNGPVEIPDAPADAVPFTLLGGP